MKGPKGLTEDFYGLLKSRKRSITVIDSYVKDSGFKEVKRDAKFKTRYVKGVLFVNKRYTKWGSFFATNGRGRGVGCGSKEAQGLLEVEEKRAKFGRSPRAGRWRNGKITQQRVKGKNQLKGAGAGNSERGSGRFGLPSPRENCPSPS